MSKGTDLLAKRGRIESYRKTRRKEAVAVVDRGEGKQAVKGLYGKQVGSMKQDGALQH